MTHCDIKQIMVTKGAGEETGDGRTDWREGEHECVLDSWRQDLAKQHNLTMNP